MNQIDPVRSHASWIENFPWTRLANTPAPDGEKTLIDHDELDTLNPQDARIVLDDGNFGVAWQTPDEVMLEAWEVGVEDTRGVLEAPWPVHAA